MSRDPDIEMAFVRSLSVHGVVLAGNLSAEDKRERIRIAILMQRREHTEFAPGVTYAEAFRRCYGKPIDLRKVVRDRFGRPMEYAQLGGEDNAEAEIDDEPEPQPGESDDSETTPGERQCAGPT